jgi:hypothetical protein
MLKISTQILTKSIKIYKMEIIFKNNSNSFKNVKKKKMMNFNKKWKILWIKR